MPPRSTKPQSAADAHQPPRRVLRLKADLDAEEAAGRVFAEMLEAVRASAPRRGQPEDGA